MQSNHYIYPNIFEKEEMYVSKNDFYVIGDSLAGFGFDKNG